MHIEDTLQHKKEFCTSQIKVTKLVRYADIPMEKPWKSQFDFQYNCLKRLKEDCEENNYFFGEVRIPKFDFEMYDDHSILIESELLFGRQLTSLDMHAYASHGKPILKTIWDSVVSYPDVPDRYGFRDLNADNFIERGKKKLMEGEPEWQLGFVDIESYQPCDLKESKREFFGRCFNFWEAVPEYDVSDRLKRPKHVF